MNSGKGSAEKSDVSDHVTKVSEGLTLKLKSE